MFATADTGEIGRGFGKNTGEWTGGVDISKEEIPDSKRSLYSGDNPALTCAGLGPWQAKEGQCKQRIWRNGEVRFIFFCRILFLDRLVALMFLLLERRQTGRQAGRQADSHVR